MKRLVIYLAVTFGLTWGLLIPAGVLLGTFENGEASSPVMLGLIALSMFFPLVGALAAVVWSALKQTSLPLYIRGAVTGFFAALFNTLLFMSLLVMFFGSTDNLAGSIAEKGVIMYIITSVGINAVVEMAVAAVVTGAAGVALKKARMI